MSQPPGKVKKNRCGIIVPCQLTAWYMVSPIFMLMAFGVLPCDNDTKHVVPLCEICNAVPVSLVGFTLTDAPWLVTMCVANGHVSRHGVLNGHAGNVPAGTYPGGQVLLTSRLLSGMATNPVGHSVAMAVVQTRNKNI